LRGARDREGQGAGGDRDEGQRRGVHQAGQSRRRPGLRNLHCAIALRGRSGRLRVALRSASCAAPGSPLAAPVRRRSLLPMLFAALLVTFACQNPVAQEPAPQEPKPAATVVSTEVERLDLGNGCTVQGRVLRETEQAIFLDVGYDVLKVPVAAVIRREGVDGRSTGHIRHETLFARAELPERSVAEGSKVFGEAVVKIEAAGGQGSGFVTHADGWIVTNFHVVKGEVEVDVVVFHQGPNGFEPRTIKKCRVDAINPAMDIALVKMDPPKELELKTVYLGDSDAMKVGDTVYAIGAPIGLDRTVSSGIISVRDRTFEGRCHFQITVPINPGNSGGPLFNLRGEVVGINSQIYSRSGGYQGVPFAIPIDLAVHVRDQLIETGKVERGKIGVTIQEVNQALADSFGPERPRGALVSSFERGGPADDAGMKPGDVILSIDGEPVERSGEVPSIVAAIKPGSEARIEVWRDRKARELEVKVGELEEERVARASDPDVAEGGRLGLAVRPLSPVEKRQADTEGTLLVLEVEGPAALAGVEPGDIVLAVNGQPVASIEELRAQVDDSGSTVALLVQRGEAQIYVPVKLG